MKRLFTALTIVVLTACGSGAGGVRATAPTPQMDIPGLQGTLDTFREVPTTTAHFAAKPEAVWPALIAVYQEMGIPVTVVDTKAHGIGSEEQRVRTIAGKRITDYVNCIDSYGSSSSYDVYLTVVTMLEPAADGSTEARTQLVATGKPPTRSSRVPCATTGSLEVAIGSRLRARLGLPPESH